MVSAPLGLMGFGALAQKATDRVSGDRWQGTLHSEMTSTFRVGAGGTCTGEAWDYTLRLVVGPDGIVEGKAVGHLVSPPKCSFTVSGTQARNRSADVSGKFDGRQFELQFKRTSNDGVTFGVDSLVDVPGNEQKILVPITAPGIAQGETKTSRTAATVVGSGHHTLTLKRCGDKDARKQHPRPSSSNCKPDRAKGCKDLEETKIAFATIAHEVIRTNDFSDKAMEKLKETIDPLLDTLRADFCDNSSAIETLDKLSDELSGLLCEGDSLERDKSLSFFEPRLNLMRRDVCGWRP